MTYETYPLSALAIAEENVRHASRADDGIFEVDDAFTSRIDAAKGAAKEPVGRSLAETVEAMAELSVENRNFALGPGDV